MRAARRGPMAVLGLGLSAVVGLSGCAVPLQEVCPRCPRLVIGERPPVPLAAQTVFVLVPGLLGYGWEWNGAQIALAQLTGAAVVVYEWNPWVSVHEGGAQLARSVQYLLRRLPRAVTRVVVLGHSAGGLLAVEAAAHLQISGGVPVTVLAVGAPLAGSYFHILGGQDNFDTPLPLAMAGVFTHWPEPAPGVQLQIWPTGKSDPVMQVRLGHDPGDARVLPRGATLHPLPSELDHNIALGWFTRKLVAQLHPPPPRPPVMMSAPQPVPAPAAAAPAESEPAANPGPSAVQPAAPVAAAPSKSEPATSLGPSAVQPAAPPAPAAARTEPAANPGPSTVQPAAPEAPAAAKFEPATSPGPSAVQN